MSKLTRLPRSLVLVALLAVLAVFASACSSDSGGPANSDANSASASGDDANASGGQASSSAPKPSKTAAPKVPVRVTTQVSDGATYGVGMPVIVYFSRKISDAKDWQAKTKVTANGQPLDAAWYFQYSSAGHGPIEAQLRPKDYWPAHSSIKVTFPPGGTKLGKQVVSDGKLTSLAFRIGARNIITVDDATNKVTVHSDGKVWGTFPTSLGAPATRTKRGIKVIMEKVPTTCMHDTAGSYYECGIKWDNRVTYDGEYLHSAPWNVGNINSGVNTSNGCTNLLPSDAERVYNFTNVGDVVDYPNADGPMMQMGQGYGLWNVQWSEYQSGGLIPTRS